MKAYRSYDDAFRWLDSYSWSVLKDKAVRHFRDHRAGQLKQGFFHQLNEALAYRHLVRRGMHHVRLLPETGDRMPDLEYFEGRHHRFCEVKTLGISEREIGRRTSGEAYHNAYLHLGDGFLNKLRHAVREARSQIEARGTGLVFVVVVPDDIAFDNYRSYRLELAAFARRERISEVHVKSGVRFNRRMRFASS